MTKQFLLSIGYNPKDDSKCTYLVAQEVAKFLAFSPDATFIPNPATAAIFDRQIPERTRIGGGVAEIGYFDDDVYISVSRGVPANAFFIPVKDDEPINVKKQYRIRFTNGNEAAAGSIADEFCSHNNLLLPLNKLVDEYGF